MVALSDILCKCNLATDKLFLRLWISTASDLYIYITKENETFKYRFDVGGAFCLHKKKLDCVSS